MKLHKYTLSDLKQSVANSTSISECLTLLGVCPYGGNYDTFRKAVKFFDIDTSHFTGQFGSAYKRKSKTVEKRLQELSTLLVENSDYKSFKLKLRLLKENIFKHECSNCGLTTWLNLPIPLELDHINGVSTDNRLENLRLLCPNCHALTPTYRGKNKKKK